MRVRFLAWALVVVGFLYGLAPAGHTVEAQAGGLPFYSGQTVELTFAPGSLPVCPGCDPTTRLEVTCSILQSRGTFVSCMSEKNLGVAYNLQYVTRVTLIKGVER